MEVEVGEEEEQEEKEEEGSGEGAGADKGWEMVEEVEETELRGVCCTECVERKLVVCVSDG